MELVLSREQTVMVAVIEQYIASAEPVSSQQLCRHYGFPYRSATVRSILATLEEKGYLIHPYTSAGKIPTVKAYRFFVEALLPPSGGDGMDRRRPYYELLKHVQEEDKLIGLTAKVLAVSSQLLAVTWMSSTIEERLAHLQLVSLSRHRLLVIVHTMAGDEFHKVFSTEETLGTLLIKQVADLVNRRARGRTADELERLAKVAWPGLERNTLKLLRRALRWTGMHLSGLDRAVRIEGASNLMEQPEFNNLPATRQLLTLLDQREQFVRSLEAPGIERQGVRVVINERAMAEAMPVLSLVSEEILSRKSKTVRIGVIGPIRMAYGKIIPLIKNTADVLAEIINIK
ncbi:heat-inducible transcriptional repressor HrcA [bacterium]|nr:heat-inducible transcriptional repressor HrcA [bacterium]